MRKFGHDRAFRLLDECLHSEAGQELSGVPLFMLEGSSGIIGTSDNSLDAIYHLSKKNVHELFSSELSSQGCIVPVNSFLCV